MAAAENQEKIDITLNYNGIDIKATVDFEISNKLLNDPDEARKYVEMILSLAPAHSPECEKLSSSDIWSTKRQSDDLNITPTFTAENVDSSNATPTHSSECGEPSSSIEIWSTKRQSDSDHEATMFFLKLRDNYSQKFNDKKTIKNTLWRKIASEMNEAGYWVGEGKEGAEKCRQKFANMQRTYLHHVKAVKTTGEEKKEPPLYFAEMHSILGAKDKINPPYLEDSLNDLSTDQEEDKTDENTRNKKEIKNRFSCGTGQKLKPTGSTTKILEQLQKQHKEDKEQRDTHFRMLKDSLDRQSAQRDKLLDILSKSLKRKRSSSESE